MGVTECQDACAAMLPSNSCISYTYHDDSTGDYAGMCYGRNDTVWALVAEAGHTSGHRLSCNGVSYTAKPDNQTLYAFFTEWPLSSGTLTLATPKRAGGLAGDSASVMLLGVPDKFERLKATWQGDSGIQVELPATLLRNVQDEARWYWALEIEGAV